MFELCKESELKENEPIECDGPDGKPLVVVLSAGKIYVAQGICPHQEAPLADGDVADGELTCCLHFWSWRLADGTPLDDETESPIKVYPVRVEDGAVFLDN